MVFNQILTMPLIDTILANYAVNYWALFCNNDAGMALR